MPSKLDARVRMIEMAVHGHLIANERIHAIATIQRHPPNFLHQLTGIWIMTKVSYQQYYRR